MKKWMSEKMRAVPLRRVIVVGGWGCAIIAAVLVLLYLWGMIFYNGPFEQAGWGNGLLGGLWVAAMVMVFIRLKPWKLRAAGWLTGLVAVLVPFLMIRPSNDREWEPEYARTGYSGTKGDVITLYNVRNFRHRGEGDFDARWESRTFHLKNLRGLDYFQSNFYGDTLAHPLLSFDFGDEGRICLSVESRREVGEKFTPFGGLYKIFELQYLFITEADCIPLRTKVREEVVRHYTIKATPAEVREMFLSSVEIQNSLLEKPRFYNVIHANCTTSLRDQRAKDIRGPWDMRLLFNGMLDEYLYERGMLETHGLSFDELRKKTIVNDAANTAAGLPDFSKRIRSAR